jgi:hypothetical protein
MRELAGGVLIGNLLGCLALGGFAPGVAEAAETQGERQVVAETILGVFRAAELKQLDRLESYHLFGPEFTKFDEFGEGREDAATARAAERRGLAGVKAFKASVQELKVDIFGVAAVATFIVVYSAETATGTADGRLRSTVVLARRDASWKIVHEHYSPLLRRQ